MNQMVDKNNQEFDLDFEGFDVSEENMGKSHDHWSKKEKILVSLFMVIGLGTLLLGFFQFYSRKTITINDVFGIDGQGTQTSINLYGENAGDNQDLRFIDTDKDGLSDYDEQTKYKTSAYLEDTDSDGINDRQEIETGQDPNCPKGQVCTFTQNQGGETSTFGAGLDIGLEDPSNTIVNQNDLDLLQGQIDVSSLRQILLENGISQDVLDQIDDQTLIDLYNQSMSPTSDTVQPQTPNNSNLDDSANSGNESIFGGLQDLSPEEVRQLMIEGGVEESVVNQLSNDQLMEVYNESLKSLLQ